MDHHFEIYLKEDFLSLYLRHDYDTALLPHKHERHSLEGSDLKERWIGGDTAALGGTARNMFRDEISPFKSFAAATHQHFQSESLGTPYKSFINNVGDGAHSVLLQSNPSPSSLRKRPVTSFLPRGVKKSLKKDQGIDEMKHRYLKYISESSGMTWTTREEEWFFTNKRLIFSTKSHEITEEWIQKVTDAVLKYNNEETI